MPTERLYFADTFLLEFDARVVAHQVYEGRPCVVLAGSADEIRRNDAVRRSYLGY